jgi:hypothetical protein
MPSRIVTEISIQGWATPKTIPDLEQKETKTTKGIDSTLSAQQSFLWSLTPVWPERFDSLSSDPAVAGRRRGLGRGWGEEVRFEQAPTEAPLSGSLPVRSSRGERDKNRSRRKILWNGTGND